MGTMAEDNRNITRAASVIVTVLMSAHVRRRRRFLYFFDSLQKILSLRLYGRFSNTECILSGVKGI